MIRHLLRLAWNRKAKNALLSLEILVSFLVLVVVMVVGVAVAAYVRIPLGFDYRDVMVLEIRDEPTEDDTSLEDHRQRLRAMMDAIRGLRGVVSVAGVSEVPMSNSGNVSGMPGAFGPVEFNFEDVTDGFYDTMDLSLVAGRWFGPEDDASPDRPVVVNRRLALSALREESPIGKDLLGDAEMEPGERRLRVIGVVDDFRRHGELALPGNFLFHRKRLDDPSTRAIDVLVIEFDPAALDGLEKRIEDTARAAAPRWGFSVKPMAAHRAESMQPRLFLLLSVALLAAFLLAMVALGLSGVFWQSIAQRRAEFGLRRAAGATAREIVGQVIGEVAALVTLVVVVGLALAAQLPLFGLSRAVGAGVFFGAVALAVVLIYLLAGLAALAPALLAARMHPADALRTE